MVVSAEIVRSASVFGNNMFGNVEDSWIDWSFMVLKKLRELFEFIFWCVVFTDLRHR